MEYGVDFSALIYEIQNEALNKMIVKSVPGGDALVLKLIRALNKRGVSTQTFMDALIEANTAE